MSLWKALLNGGVAAAQAAGTFAREAVASAEKGLAQLNNRPGVRGATAAVVLVGLADGRLDIAEVNAAVESLKHIFPRYTDQDLRSAIEAHLNKVKPMTLSVGQTYLLGEAADNVTDGSARRVLVSVLIEVAMADRAMSDNERAMLGRIIGIFNLEKRDFPELNAPVATGAASPAVSAPTGSSAPGAGWV